VCIAKLSSTHAIEHDDLGAHAGERAHDSIEVTRERSLDHFRLDEKATP
jgi:hypothetical protein